MNKKFSIHKYTWKDNSLMVVVGRMKKKNKAGNISYQNENFGGNEA